MNLQAHMAPPPKISRDLIGRIALVTGASRGIGRAVAVELARAGAHVIALARTQGALEQLDDEVRALGSEATLVPCDVKDYPALDRLGAATTTTGLASRSPRGSSASPLRGIPRPRSDFRKEEKTNTWILGFLGIEEVTLLNPLNPRIPVSFLSA